MGEIPVPADAYWGAQTQRSLEHFKIGTEKIPGAVIAAFALLKQSAARANEALGVLESEKAAVISRFARKSRR
jgi:fumarate hydratase class II